MTITTVQTLVTLTANELRNRIELSKARKLEAQAAEAGIETLRAEITMLRNGTLSPLAGQAGNKGMALAGAPKAEGDSGDAG